MSKKSLSVDEILKHPIFQQIDEAETEQKKYELLSLETPIEWTVEGTSEVSGEKYRYLPINVLEALMDRVFGRHLLIDVESKIILTTLNSCVTVTTSVALGYGFSKSIILRRQGVASVTVEDNFYYDKDGRMHFKTPSKKPVKAMQLLSTATPLSLSEARKNAIKNICPLFGRNLNRNIVEALPIVNTEEEVQEQDETTLRFNKAKLFIEGASTKEIAAELLNNEYSEFKFNVELKAIINSKK